MFPPLPLISAIGTPRKCGTTYGSVAALAIAANTANYMARFAAVGIDVQRARDYGALFRVASHRHAPRVAEMLDGVAEGARVNVDEIYALNGRTELIYSVDPDDAGSDRRAGAGECTAVAVLGERSTSGHTLLAQNWDWHPDQRPYALLLDTTDEHGRRVVALTEAGMLAKAGLNDAGLGVCVNMLGTTRDRRDGGVPYHVLLRAALEQPHLGAAIRAVCSVPRGASINLLMGQAFPGGTPGEAIDLEVAPGDVGFVHPVDGVITHANHFESALSAVDTLKSIGSSSFFRAARARRLLGTGPIGEERIKAVLCDHGGFPASICRHDQGEEVDDADRTESLFTLVLDLDERRISIAPGPACRGVEYRHIRMDKSG
ncbi:C45 family autoproteolytic acyltransferase/hydrolase [Dactylosporangium sp. McL0621]|uniref:C45 family autoproteolytic acyltransferase/hydolase n=1 Tax=Dactylosporangium sp. McL0621 TaxID=3415678 RepID=UPI003CE9455C